jgi:hypothetical protein
MSSRFFINEYNKAGYLFNSVTMNKVAGGKANRIGVNATLTKYI